MSGALAAASDPHAELAALAAIAAGGRCIDALLAAFFAAAAAHPGVLLGPATALVGGVGSGTRLFDGRCAQPGRGAKRPRGFLDSEPIPPAARVAVPRALPMMALLHAHGAHLSLEALVRRPRAMAEQLGAPERARLLAEIGQRASGALRTQEAERALLAAGGFTAGGLLTHDDLMEVVPEVVAAPLVQLAGGLTVGAPVQAPRDVPGPRATRAAARAQDGADGVAVVVAADPRGMVGALAYAPTERGVDVPELGLRLCAGAAPVRRRVSRVTPGTALPMSAPIGLLTQESEGWFAALAITAARCLVFEPLAQGGMGASLREAVERVLDASDGALGLGVSVQRRRTTLARVGRSRRGD